MGIDRRSFIFASGAFAASVAGGITTVPPRLKVGLGSDTHIQDEARARHFEVALRYFRDCGVDAVMHVGDISDWGLVSAWRYASEAWERVFPGNRAPDGREIVKLFTTGNHDFEGIKYWDQKEEMRARGGAAATSIFLSSTRRRRPFRQCLRLKASMRRARPRSEPRRRFPTAAYPPTSRRGDSRLPDFAVQNQSHR